MMTDTQNAAPGTAALYRELCRVLDEEQKACERRRAMLLSWVDEAERFLGYGSNGQQPRTAQIRQWWRDQGEPRIG